MARGSAIPAADRPQNQGLQPPARCVPRRAGERIAAQQLRQGIQRVRILPVRLRKTREPGRDLARDLAPDRHASAALAVGRRSGDVAASACTRAEERDRRIDIGIGDVGDGARRRASSAGRRPRAAIDGRGRAARRRRCGAPSGAAPRPRWRAGRADRRARRIVLEREGLAAAIAPERCGCCGRGRRARCTATGRPRSARGDTCDARALQILVTKIAPRCRASSGRPITACRAAARAENRMRCTPAGKPGA